MSPASEEDPAVPPQEPVATRPAPQVTVSETLRDEVRDALSLLNYVVSTGAKQADGSGLSLDVMAAIKKFAADLGLPDDATDRDRARARRRESAQDIVVPAADWIAFETNYYALSVFTAPVTAETLRNTEQLRDGEIGRSPAQRFTTQLWFWTLAFALLIVWGEWGLQWYGESISGDAGLFNLFLQSASIVQPYLYGGLGACAYLLRSAHRYIHERTFDMRRNSEYFNRILIGAVSGGAIVLFVSQISDEDGNVVRLSSAALGFLAGYSNDFLFNVIERIIQAILPKVGINTVAQRPPAPAAAGITIQSGDISLADLLVKLEAASPEDKEFYKALILKAQGAA
jgi:hypothetical protein